MQSDKYAGMDPDELRNLGEYDTIVFRTFSAAGSSFPAGHHPGRHHGHGRTCPLLETERGLPALLKTGRIMGNYGLKFVAIGGIFAFTEAVSASVRGKKEIWNSAIGGAAAGSILGLRGC